MEEGDFALSILGIIEFHKFWVDAEVRDANLGKEFIDCGCRIIRL